MVLHVDSYAAYITMTEARSCYDEHFYLRNWTSPRPEKLNLDRNSPIHKECKTIYNVVSSVEVAEKRGNFNNRKTDIFMPPALITLDHKQPEKTLKTNNSTAEGFVNSGMNPKRSKTWGMKWNWLRDKEVFEKFRLL